MAFFLKLVPMVETSTDWRRPLEPATRPIGRVMRSVRATYRVLHGWWEREGQRRELSAMRARDFGDLAVPPSLVIEELRRWPWQKPNSQWGEVAAGRRNSNAEDGSDGLTRNAP
jgi:uncharacterized protein YjiS (DUF1127 family)